MSESTRAEATGGELAATGTTYVYDDRRYLFDVQITGVVGAVAVVAGIVMVAANFLAFVGVIAFVVGLYTAFNTFVARCYPRTVTLGEKDVTFESFGRRDTYALADITRLQVRENARARINGGGHTRGRYFVGCGDMYDESGEKARALFDFFLDTEARLDPDNIRVRARRQEAAKAKGDGKRR